MLVTVRVVIKRDESNYMGDAQLHVVVISLPHHSTTRHIELHQRLKSHYKLSISFPFDIVSTQT